MSRGLKKNLRCLPPLSSHQCLSPHLRFSLRPLCLFVCLVVCLVGCCVVLLRLFVVSPRAATSRRTASRCHVSSHLAITSCLAVASRLVVASCFVASRRAHFVRLVVVSSRCISTLHPVITSPCACRRCIASLHRVLSLHPVALFRCRVLFIWLSRYLHRPFPSTRSSYSGSGTPSAASTCC